MGLFSEKKVKAGDKVWVPSIGSEGTIIDVEDRTCMVEAYGDDMRRIVEVVNVDELRKR